MSHVDINAFGPDGACREIAQVRNGMAGAMTIWTELSQKYRLEMPFSSMRDGKLPIWTACNQGKVSEADSICVRFTYDNVWVKRENTPKLIEALRMFHRDHVEGTGITPTIEGIATALETALKEDETLLGFSFNQTSVNPNPWLEGEDCTPYNVLTGTRHWELFEDWKLTPEPENAAPPPPA